MRRCDRGGWRRKRRRRGRKMGLFGLNGIYRSILLPFSPPSSSIDHSQDDLCPFVPRTKDGTTSSHLFRWRQAIPYPFLAPLFVVLLSLSHLGLYVLYRPLLTRSRPKRLSQPSQSLPRLATATSLSLSGFAFALITRSGSSSFPSFPSFLLLFSLA